jgi:hypothetical protein
VESGSVFFPWQPSEKFPNLSAVLSDAKGDHREGVPIRQSQVSAFLSHPSELQGTAEPNSGDNTRK